MTHRIWCNTFAWALIAGCPFTRASTIISLTPDQDAVVAASFASNNYGGAGAISVSGPSNTRGEQWSMVRFDLAAATLAFDTDFGAGNWLIDSVTLHLTSQVPGGMNPLFNTPKQGQFVVEWVPSDSWIEGTGTPMVPSTTGLTWAGIAALQAGAQVGATISYDGTTGSAIDSSLAVGAGLLADLTAGSSASFMMRPLDPDMAAIFNSRSAMPGNFPRLIISASSVPEPGRVALLLSAFTGLLARRRRTIQTGSI